MGVGAAKPTPYPPRCHPYIYLTHDKVNELTVNMNDKSIQTRLSKYPNSSIIMIRAICCTGITRKMFFFLVSTN